MSGRTTVMALLGLGLLALLVYGTVSGRKMYKLIQTGNDLADQAAQRSYEQHPAEPGGRILVIGDSSAVGTGAESAAVSTAGRLGELFPKAEIINAGVNGAKVVEIPPRLLGYAGERFDLILIQIGGNDIVRFTPYGEMTQSIIRVLVAANELTDQVILLHGGNVGTSRLFPQPLRGWYTVRTNAVRDIWKNQAEKYGAHYVDLIVPAGEDPFLQDPGKYYAPDIFHPSGEGYGWWFEGVERVIKDNGLTVPAAR